MSILIQFALLIAGFVLLIKGADWFVEGAAGMADKFGIPQLVIGLTIVAMGTSAPEAAVSITSAVKGNAGITVGNVLGSNIMNVLLILGVTAVIISVPVQKSTFMYEIPYLIIVSSLFLFLGMDGIISRIDGVILWIAFIIYFIYLVFMAKKGKAQEESEHSGKQKPWWLLIVLTIIGMGMVMFGSDVTVNSASAIADEFGMDSRLIGLTIVAFGTSLPELVTSVIAAKKGSTDIAIGNIVGSNIFNILFVAGTTGLITPVEFKADFIIDSVISIGAVMLLMLCILKGRKLTRPGGAVMLMAYMGYFVYLLL
ncbi:MAG: calcium/sodium antiporter [Lachnospiraceae bacterium]|nr:calcium/sodium antiporter [Lachnospiraceae bacterium]MDE6251531.1 calcium/sodium antiporter [Lachnospiraceae bacterium]